MVKASRATGSPTWDAPCISPCKALRVWAESHVEDVHAAQDRYDEPVDDAILRSVQTT